jgi:hypothetical protein
VAHIALDRRIGRDPSAYQEAAVFNETQPIVFPALGPFASSLLSTGIPDFAAVDVVQNAVILPTAPQPEPPPVILGGFGGGAAPLFSEPTADAAIVTFRPGSPPTVDRIELQNGQVRQRGTAAAVDAAFVDNIIGLERWTGPNGSYSDGTTSATLPTTNHGLHVLYGIPATNLPTSTTVNYLNNVAHSTPPTLSDGAAAPGTLNYANMRIAFGPMIAGSRVALEAGVSIATETFSFATNGGLGNINLSQIILQSNGRFSSGGATIPVSYSYPGNVCTGTLTCFANVEGFLAGPGGNHAGFIYQFGDIRSVTGGVILRQGGVYSP